MNYTVRKTKEASRSYKDHSGRTWSLLTPKQYNQMPKSHKRICGDMHRTDSGSLERLLTLETEEGNQTIGLHEYRSHRKWYQTVKGYIPASTEEGTPCCVRVLGVSPSRSILIPLLILAVLAGLILLWLKYIREEEVPGLDETAVAYRMEGLVNTDPDNTMLPMLSNITVEASDGHADNVLINPEGNGCYFIYSVTRNDTGEELYKSGMIEPGRAVIGFDLEQIPEPGEYDVTVGIETRDIDNYEQNLNGGEMEVTLTVLE